MKKRIPSMQHLNKNLLCAIDVETTGLDAAYHEIVEIALIPLDADLEPIQEIPVFHKYMNPVHKDRISKGAMRIHQIQPAALEASGDPAAAAGDFEFWFDKYVKGWSFRKIAPLAHNWKFDHAFIEQWLDWDYDIETGEHKNHSWMDDFFEPRARDTMRVGTYINDLAYLRNQPFPFPKVNLTYMCNMLEIPHGTAHSAYDDALATSRLYKKLLKMTANYLTIDFGE